MLKLEGKYNTAKVFTDNVDNETISQIIQLLNQEFTIGTKIRIMPDTHAGKGCVIGYTANLGDKIVPNLVGVDIGCGMFVVELGKNKPNLEKLDKIVHNNIPHGKDVHPTQMGKFSDLELLLCQKELKDVSRILRAIGTLGGGNHFIELNKDNDGNHYLVIHSGSRNLGKQVAELYQNIAIDILSGKDTYKEEREKIITRMKELGRTREISPALQKLDEEFKKKHPPIPQELCYLDGLWRDRYLHDVLICQGYASLNRYTMGKIIIEALTGKEFDRFRHWETIHNYVEKLSDGSYIIRKGAIRATEGERVIIPINMRDGSIIARGKGNSDWNYSAPHGAGRIMSRSQAKRELDVEEYKKQMDGIYSTTVGEATIDEAPGAYKSIEEIIENTRDTIEIEKIIQPVYNFKSGE